MSLSSVVGAGRAAEMPRPPTPLGALALATDSVGQRAAIFKYWGYIIFVEYIYYLALETPKALDTRNASMLIYTR